MTHNLCHTYICTLFLEESLLGLPLPFLTMYVWSVRLFIFVMAVPISSLSTWLWLVFDPGNPDALDCSEGPSRLVAQLIWFLYNLVAAVTLMNLLIALMSAGIRELLHLDFFVSLIKEMLNNVFLPPIVKEHSTFHTQKLCTA